MLTYKDLKICDSIENKNPYEGEGELMFVGEEKFDMLVFIVACNTKYPSLNGQKVVISKNKLVHYKKVK